MGHPVLLPVGGDSWHEEMNAATEILDMDFKPASSAILIRDGRMLLVRRANPPAADLYAFPGGRGEAGETPEDTAIREFLEETGIAVRDPVLFATYDLANLPDGPHFRLSVFLVASDDSSDGTALDDAADIGWYGAAEVTRLPAPDSVRDCVNRLLAAGHLPALAEAGL